MNPEDAAVYPQPSRRERREQKQAASDERQAQEDLKSQLANPQGRRVVWRWLVACGVFDTPFAGVDAVTNFKTGRQSVGMELQRDCFMIAPELYAQMLVENEFPPLAEPEKDEDDDE